MRLLKAQKGQAKLLANEEGAGEAAAVQANWIWLISGTTMTEFSQKVNAQNGTGHSGLQETGCEKLPWNCTVFLMNPQEGIGCPSASLRRDQMGWNFGCKEQYSK